MLSSNRAMDTITRTTRLQRGFLQKSPYFHQFELFPYLDCLDVTKKAVAVLIVALCDGAMLSRGETETRRMELNFINSSRGVGETPQLSQVSIQQYNSNNSL